MNHPSKSEFKKVWDRYVFALDADKLIDGCTQLCHLCNSLKQIPNELFEQSTSKIPKILAEQFFADILWRAGQSVLAVREVLSSFTTAAIIENEKAETLRESLIDKEFITIQKFVGSKLRSKKYLVKCDEIFPAVETKFRKEKQLSSDEDTELEEEFEPKIQPLRRSMKNRKSPSWLTSNEYDLS